MTLIALMSDYGIYRTLAELTIGYPHLIIDLIAVSPRSQSWRSEVLDKHPQRIPTLTLYPTRSTNPYSQINPYLAMLGERSSATGWTVEFNYPEPLLLLGFRSALVNDVLGLIGNHELLGRFWPEWLAGDSDGVVPVYFEERVYNDGEIRKLTDLITRLEGAEKL